MAMSQPSLKSIQPHTHAPGEFCPWCEQPIPEDQSENILNRIQERERQQNIEQEARFKQEFAQERAKAVKQFEREKIEAAAKVREEVAKEKEKAIEQIKMESAVKETAIRDDAKKKAEKAQAEILTAAQKATDEVKVKLKVAEENKETEINIRLTEQRTALEKDKADAVNVFRSKSYEEKLKWEEQINKLKRQLEQKTANELGEGAEIKLLDMLKGAFKSDHIEHVGKGKSGADVIHDVKHNGKICGRIIYDSKDRSAWRSDYVSKLRDDQIAAKAEYAILSSNVFPGGAKQLHEQDGVIIASPARVLVLVQMLRRSIVQMHTLRMSNQEREEKTATLYEFIRSDRCQQLFERIDEHADDLLELQEKERKQHELNWKKQGTLYRAIQKTNGNLTSSLDRIIGTAD